MRSAAHGDSVTFVAVDYAFIPSPAQSVWEIPLPFGLAVPIRAYALCIVAGIVAACWVVEALLRRRGAPRFFVLDLAVWAVPFGIVGGRLYHVVTSPDAYFGADGEPLKAFAVWEGGLGVPGAIVLGGVGVWIACRRGQVPFSMVADAAAIGLPLGQAVARPCNWFNQELYGLPTNAPWGVEIDAAHQRDIPPEFRGAEAYEPAFLYESLWNFGLAAVIWRLDKRFKFGAGRAFAIYVLGYGVGRFWIEGRRIDVAHDFLGLRVNEWLSLVMIVGAIVYLLRVKGKRGVLVPGEAGGLRMVDWDSADARAGKLVEVEVGSGTVESEVSDEGSAEPDESKASS